MTILASIIRGSATAIPAIPATATPNKAPSVAGVAAIAGRGDGPFAGIPTLDQEREIRAQLVRLLPGADHPDFPEALALALADPDTHLEGFRTSRPPEVTP